MALQQRAALQAAMADTAQEQQLDEVLFFVVDVLNEEATFVSASPRAARLVEAAWGVKVDAEGTARLRGVLSRKKQIIPALEEAADRAGAATAAAAAVAPCDDGSAADGEAAGEEKQGARGVQPARLPA